LSFRRRRRKLEPLTMPIVTASCSPPGSMRHQLRRRSWQLRLNPFGRCGLISYISKFKTDVLD
jgi:hypothetical protein